jgi:hypothetical protein
MPWTFYNANGQRLSSRSSAIANLDINGGADIGEAIVDADLFVTYNDSGTANTKTAASRVQAYASPLISCRVYSDAAQSIGNNSNTIVTFNQEVDDAGGMHDNSSNNSRITIPAGQGGLYIVSAIVMWAHNATGQRHCEFFLNGGTSLAFYTCNGVVGDSGASLALTGTILREFDAGDYIEIRVYQASGGSLNINGTTEQNHTFSAAKIHASSR